MGEETQLAEAGKGLRKRKIGHKKGNKGNKRAKMFQNPGPKKVKITKKMQKLFRKRAREYNSDDEDEEGDEKVEKIASLSREIAGKKKVMDKNLEEDEGFDGVNSGEEILGSDDDDVVDGIQPGVMRFSEGCRAFKIAFKKIIKRNISDDLLGPVLSGHKKLVVEKLAEEEAERKGKGEAKKEKLLLAEKGHVKPANFLDAHEKFLIGVATKGVVKLFNAVNKAQAAQKGLNPLRSKDAKDLKKRRKEAFFSELGKKRLNSDWSSSKANASKNQNDGDGPAWAPLRDNYMLTNSKLKDWDKMQDTSAGDDVGRITQDSSDDD